MLIATDKNLSEEVKENQNENVYLRFEKGDYQLNITGEIVKLIEIKSVNRLILLIWMKKEKQF